MTDNRAISVALNYVIMLGVATVVLASVVFISGVVIDGQLDRGVEEELTATGETLAADIQSAQGLADASPDPNNSTIELTSRLSPTVSGTAYTIVVDGEAQELRLTSSSPASEVVVPFRAARVTGEHTVRAGAVVIVLEEGTLEVREG